MSHDCAKWFKLLAKADILFLIAGNYINHHDLRYKFKFKGLFSNIFLLAWSVESPTADPGFASLIPARSHTFIEIDHEIISTVILLLPVIQEGLLSVTSESMCTKYWLNALSSLQRKKKVWLGELTVLTLP